MVPDGNSGYHDQEFVYNCVSDFKFSWVNRFQITLGKGIIAVYLHTVKQEVARVIR